MNETEIKRIIEQETIKYYKDNFITEIHLCNYFSDKIQKIHRVLNKTANYTDLICLSCGNQKTVMSKKWIRENLW